MKVTADAQQTKKKKTNGKCKILLLSSSIVKLMVGLIMLGAL